MTKRSKTIGDIFDEGNSIDAAIKRAVRRAVRPIAKVRKTSSKPRPKRRAA